MKEVKLKIDKKFDVKSVLKEYFYKKNITEFYERNIKADNKNIIIIVYEEIRQKMVYTDRGPRDVEIFVTNTVIISEKADSTAVAIVLPSDADDCAFGSFDLMLKDYGFYYSNTVKKTC